MAKMLRQVLVLPCVLTLACSAPTEDVVPRDAEPVLQADVGVDADVARDLDAAPDAASAPEKRSVFEPGPYGVGYRAWKFTYDAPDEPGREIRLAVWYPTRDEEGTDARYANLIRREEALADASVAVDEPMPMLVFSHGNSSLAEQSYFMTEFFASHGWVVAAPDHTHNTFRDTEGSINLASAAVRPLDVIAAIDVMYDLPEDDPLHGLVSDDIVLTGHSFGGYTTLANAGARYAVDEAVAACEAGEFDPSLCELFTEEQIERFRAGFLDPRIDVAIPQTPAGAQIFRDGLADIEMPTLLMTGSMDATLPNEEEGDPIWHAMQGEHLRLDLVRGGHFTFSNMCDLFGSFVEEVANDGCSDAFIEPATAFEIINAYSLAFARYHLFEDEEAAELLFAESSPWAEELTISRK